MPRCRFLSFLRKTRYRGKIIAGWLRWDLKKIQDESKPGKLTLRPEPDKEVALALDAIRATQDQ